MKVDVQGVGVLEFPDDAKPDEISEVLNKQYPNPKEFGESAVSALNRPGETPNASETGYLDVANAAVEDIAAKGINHPVTGGVIPNAYRAMTGKDLAKPGEPMVDIKRVPASLFGVAGMAASALAPKATEGVEEEAGRLVSGFTTPGAAVTLPFAESKPVQSYFAAQSASAIPEQYRRVKEAETPKDKAAAIAGMTATVGMTGLMGAGLARGEPAPLAKPALEPKVGEVPKAVSEPASPPPIPEQAPGTKSGVLLSKPDLSAEELINLRPDEVVTWKKNVTLGPDVEKSIAAKLSDEDVANLELERDNLRAKSTALNALMEKRGKADDRTMKAAGEESVKAQTINEILQERESLKQQPASILPEGVPTKTGGTADTPPAPQPVDKHALALELLKKDSAAVNESRKAQTYEASEGLFLHGLDPLLSLARAQGVKADMQLAGTGSHYLVLEVPTEFNESGEPTHFETRKYRVADHDASIFREKQFGFNTGERILSKAQTRAEHQKIGEWLVDKIVKAAEDANGNQYRDTPWNSEFDYLLENATAAGSVVQHGGPVGLHGGGAGIKTPLETQSQRPSGVRARHVATEPEGIADTSTEGQADKGNMAALQSGKASALTGVTTPQPGNTVNPKLVGMGGAVASEFKTNPETPTSIKNAQVDVERQKRGLPPAIQPARRSFGNVWDETMAKIDRDPGYQDRLLGELRDNPRALTDSEDAAILHRQIDLQNEYGKATRDLAQAYDDGRMDDVGREKARVAALSDQLLDLYNIGKKVGTETGRGLNARKMMAYEDFSLAKMELEKRAVNGGKPLTDAERTQITELQSRIESTQKAYDEYVSKTEQRIAELELKRALDEVENQAKKEPTVHPRILAEAERVVGIMEKAADAARARLREKFARTSAGVDPTILSDLSIIGAAKIARGIVDFGKWSDAMVKDIGEGIQPFLKEAWDTANKKFDESVDRYSKAGKASQVKRAVKKSDVAEQTAAIKEAVRERLGTGDKRGITSQVQKLARLLVGSGVTDRAALIDGVHSFLQSIDPQITRREAMDAISGYGDFRQLTKDEISVKLRDLKGQMQQVAKLEDMQSGKPPLKTGLERRIPSQEESRLIKLVNEAKNQFQIPIDDPGTQLKSSLDTLKTRLKNATLEYQDKLKRGDFAKKPKRIVQMDAEANRLHFENAKAKLAWHEALMKDRLANRSIPQKILGGISETMNTARAVMTSFDLSAVLRQGGFIAFGHPIRALKSFPAMFRAMASEAGQHAINQEIMARKNYPLYNQSKLYLSEHGHKLSQMEEAYMSRWADKIPGVAASQRAYVTFLNKLRADSFDAMAATLSRDGELTPLEANAISNFINVATGRGNLGMKENALVGLNSIFFAPRYVASRFQLLAGQPLYRGTPRTRTLVAKEYARFLVGIGTVYALAQAGGADVETDPRSSDFGKIKLGNTRVDPLAGLSQSSVLLGRIGSGETKNAKGKIIPIRGPKFPYGAANSADVMARFLRSKLSPAIGLGVDVATGKDVVGKPVTKESISSGLLIPLSMRDIYEAMKENGVPAGAALGILALFGMSVQTYDDKKKATTTGSK